TLGGDEREPSRPIGLRHEPAGEVLRRVEVPHQSGQPRGQAGGVESVQLADATATRQRRGPELLDADTVRCDYTQPGDHAHVVTRFGLVSTIALWNPPKPLPTVSTVSVRCSRAATGT